MEKYNFGSDDHVLLQQNILGIDNYTDLEVAEQFVFLVKSLEISQGKYTVVSFDLKGLQSLHNYLFGDIYSFAGKIRNVQLTKGSTRFCQALFIHSEAARIFTEMKQEDEWATKHDAAKRLAYFKAELNMLHPFREGNGRAIRIFLHAWAKSKGYYWAYEHL